MIPERSRWLFVGLGVAALWLGLSTIGAYRNTESIANNAKQSLASYDILKNLGEVSTNMAIAESGRRGYIFLNDPQELLRYQHARNDLSIKLVVLYGQLFHNPTQLAQMEQLRYLIYARLELLQESVERYRQTPEVTPWQIEITKKSVGLREQIQDILKNLTEAEELQLRRGVMAYQNSLRSRNAIEAGLTLSLLTSLVLAAWVLYRQVISRQIAETQRQQMAQQTELNELKLRFFSMVSHEFRTPLTIILGSTQLLTEGNPAQLAIAANSTTTVSRSLQRIQSAAKSMIQMLNDMLMLTRADAGKLEYHPAEVELVSFCLNLIEDINLAIEDDDRVQFHNYTKWHYAYLDEKLLYSMVSNLMINAIKYDPQKHPIQFFLDGNADWVKFVIQDQGLGISPDYQKHLYEPFYRGDNVGKIAGTGLGLAVVKKCVDLHHGRIDVTSDENQGTTFTIELPRHFLDNPKPT
jgi:signal transduction histidine kinase